MIRLVRHEKSANDARVEVENKVARTQSGVGDPWWMLRYHGLTTRNPPTTFLSPGV